MSTLPGNIQIEIEKVSNPSMLFDKCLNEYSFNTQEKYRSLEKIASSLTSSYKFGQVDVYKAYKQRMENLAEGLRSQGYKVKKFKLKSVSGLCIGMGRDSAIENGITLERNLGIPIIPSSSIKGVVRSYVTLYGTEKEQSKINKYFGSDDEQNPKPGEVDFLNAYMIADVKDYKVDIKDYKVDIKAYKVDIINNHFPDYYSDQNAKTPPNDWFNPIPVYFIRISEEKIFEFTIIGQDDEILSEVQILIEKAFKEVGVGGKTSVGYGRMEEWKK